MGERACREASGREYYRLGENDLRGSSSTSGAKVLVSLTELEYMEAVPSFSDMGLVKREGDR